MSIERKPDHGDVDDTDRTYTPSFETDLKSHVIPTTGNSTPKSEPMDPPPNPYFGYLARIHTLITTTILLYTHFLLNRTRINL